MSSFPINDWALPTTVQKSPKAAAALVFRRWRSRTESSRSMGTLSSWCGNDFGFAWLSALVSTVLILSLYCPTVRGQVIVPVNGVLVALLSCSEPNSFERFVGLTVFSCYGMFPWSRIRRSSVSIAQSLLRALASVLLRFDRWPVWNSWCLCRLQHGCRLLPTSPTNGWSLQNVTSISILEVCGWNWTERYAWCALGATQAGFHQKMKLSHRDAFMSLICVGSHLKRWKKAEDTEKVGKVGYLPVQLYLDTLRHVCNFAWYFVIIVFKSVGQAEGTAVQTRPTVCTERPNEVSNCVDECSFCAGTYRLNEVWRYFHA